MSGKDYTIWSDISKSKHEPDGSFKRQDSAFRNVIKHGGEYKPERGRDYSPILSNFRSNDLLDRYHLYVSYACRWSWNLQQYTIV